MKTVFLIDDDADDREIFQAALQTLEVETTYVEAVDGQQALELISGHNFEVPDIIFADLNMPKLTGREFLREARKIEAYKHVPVFMYSTSSVRSEQDQCIEEGATGFVVKHSSFDDLCEELKSIVGA